jgi:hypothetical protein
MSTNEFTIKSTERINSIDIIHKIFCRELSKTELANALKFINYFFSELTAETNTISLCTNEKYLAYYTDLHGTTYLTHDYVCDELLTKVSL